MELGKSNRTPTTQVADITVYEFSVVCEQKGGILTTHHPLMTAEPHITLLNNSAHTYVHMCVCTYTTIHTVSDHM